MLSKPFHEEINRAKRPCGHKTASRAMGLGSPALSGCDTVSSFAEIGKSSVLKKLSSYGDELVFDDLPASLENMTASCLKFETAFTDNHFLDHCIKC